MISFLAHGVVPVQVLTLCWAYRSQGCLVSLQMVNKVSKLILAPVVPPDTLGDQNFSWRYYKS